VSGAQTRHYGMELSLAYQLAADWLFSLDGNIAEHQYDSRVSLLGSDGDIKGNDIDTAPNVFGSARLNWDFSRLSGQDSVAELEWVYMDEYFLDPDNEHKYDGHSLLNLRVSSTLGPRWQATLRLTNLLDEQYAERADFGFGSYRYFVGQPRGALRPYQSKPRRPCSPPVCTASIGGSSPHSPRPAIRWMAYNIFPV
jgi:outer membrane receptor protein involved in Fe transport